MSEKKTEPLQTSLRDEKAIEALIRLGGQRDEIDPEQAARVRRHVYQAWLQRQALQDRQSPSHQLQAALQYVRLRFRYAFASLAAIALVFFSVQQLLQDKPEAVASVSHLAGQVVSEGARLTAAKTLVAGAVIRTGSPAEVALDLWDGGVLKLGPESEIHFLDRNNVRLLSGALYFDSAGRGSIRVHTPHGVASDIGTQFETRLTDVQLIVRVRDGKVRVDQGSSAVLVDSGQALHLANGAAEITAIPPGDAPWVWADAMDLDFSLDGRSMAEILSWLAARESWTLRYQNDTARQRAREEIIHGKLNTEDSRALLRQLALISDMRFELKANSLLVDYPL
jgi:ferric-dicitrate binding protein FerR (iron transport regulator)